MLSGGRPSSESTVSIAVHAHSAQIERCNAKCLAADFAIPAIEAPEIQIRLAVRQASGLDGVRVVHKEKENIAVAGVKRGGVLGDIHERIVRHGRPIQNARHFPHGIARAVARDLHHGGDKLMVPDAAVVRSGHGAQFNASVFRFQRLHKLGAMRQQAML